MKGAGNFFTLGMEAVKDGNRFFGRHRHQTDSLSFNGLRRLFSYFHAAICPGAHHQRFHRSI